MMFAQFIVLHFVYFVYSFVRNIKKDTSLDGTGRGTNDRSSYGVSSDVSSNNIVSQKTDLSILKIKNRSIPCYRTIAKRAVSKSRGRYSLFLLLSKYVKRNIVNSLLHKKEDVGLKPPHYIQKNGFGTSSIIIIPNLY